MADKKSLKQRKTETTLAAKKADETKPFSEKTEKNPDLKSETKTTDDPATADIFTKDGHHPWIHNYLFFTAVCFFCAFASYYPQIRGLIGYDGLQTFTLDEATKICKSARRDRHLVGFCVLAPHWMDPIHSIEFLCLLGILTSIYCCITRKFTIWNFLILVLSYDSLIITGREFMRFQWDSLLMETGWLALINVVWPARNSKIPGFLIMFTAAKLMLNSSVVKLYSACEYWWSLKALW